MAEISAVIFRQWVPIILKTLESQNRKDLSPQDAIMFWTFMVYVC